MSKRHRRTGASQAEEPQKVYVSGFRVANSIGEWIFLAIILGAAVLFSAIAAGMR